MRNLGGENAFSLVEVVMAIGIFVVAILTLLGLFGSSIKGVKLLADRDALSGMAGSVADRLSVLSRSELSAIPAGTAGDNRPVFYRLVEGMELPEDAVTDTGGPVWTDSPPVGGRAGRVFRATLYRALDPQAVEYVFSPSTPAFPVRVVVDVLAPGQSTGTPELSWTFHQTVIPDR